jgi:hypothetical protein
MISTIVTAIAASFLIVGTWAADLACYHPQAASLDPLGPINTTIAWKECLPSTRTAAIAN